MRLGVTGTRNGLTPAQQRWAILAAEREAREVTEFHYGDCIGVDEQMLWILLAQGVEPELHIYPALVSEKWRAKTLTRLQEIMYGGMITQYKALPPMLRNGFIAEACDELWAFPGSGRGTWDCIRKAREMGRRGAVIMADGTEVDL